MSFFKVHNLNEERFFIVPEEFREKFIDITDETILDERLITTIDYNTNVSTTRLSKVYDVVAINSKLFITISTELLDAIILPSSNIDRTVVVYCKPARRLNNLPDCRIDAKPDQTIYLDTLDSRNSVKVLQGSTRRLRIFKGKNEWFEI